MQMTIENFYGYPLLHSITPFPVKGHYIPVTVIMFYGAVQNDLMGVSSSYHDKTWLYNILKCIKVTTFKGTK